MPNRRVYLDHAAATPMSENVRLAMEPYFSANFSNPSAAYLSAKKVASDIAKARSNIAQCLGAKESEIIFTAGGTEANNLAIKGIMELYPDANILISAVEHESVVKPAQNYNYKTVPVKKDGTVDLVSLEALIDDNTVLVSVMYANNEIGTIQPISSIASIIKRLRKSRNNDLPLLLHTDACQAPAYLDLHISRLGVDFMSLNSGKIYGPKQFGCLYKNRLTAIKSQIEGGGQEFNIRSGTENPANISGFSVALEQATKNRNIEVERMKLLQDLFITELKKLNLDISINGSLKKRLPNNVHVTFAGKDNETMLMELDEVGVECASGSACSASSDEVSPTLMAIGMSEDEARSSLRFSMGISTSKEDILYTIKKIAEILQ